MSVLATVLEWLSSRVVADERGANYVEYGLLVSLVAVVCLVGIQFLGSSVAGFLFGAAGKL